MNLVIELPKEKLERWEARAQAEGLSVERWVERSADSSAGVAIADDVPIWEAILENTKSVPDAAFVDLPVDGASEVDHYLYGHPKRNS